jgi:hypothetical protein
MSDLVLINDFIEVPPMFFPEGSEEPFKYCKLCNKELIENEERYVIEKAYSQDLTSKERKLIFEVAYCVDCLNQIHEEFSRESREMIYNYFKQNSNLEARYKGLSENKLFDLDLWLQNCIVKNKSIDEVEEFQIMTLCEGGDMLFYHASYMICGEAMDEVMDLLSKKTLDIIDDLMIDIVDVPPEMEELFKTRKPILI